MRRRFYLGMAGLPIVGLVLVGLAWAQQYSSLVDWVEQQKIVDNRKAWAVVIRDTGRLLDGYSTPTGQQKFDALLHLSEAVCSGTQTVDIAMLLTPQERANVRIVWRALIAEWEARQEADDASQRAIFNTEVQE